MTSNIYQPSKDQILADIEAIVLSLEAPVCARDIVAKLPYKIMPRQLGITCLSELVFRERVVRAKVLIHHLKKYNYVYSASLHRKNPCLLDEIYKGRMELPKNFTSRYIKADCVELLPSSKKIEPIRGSSLSGVELSIYL